MTAPRRIQLRRAKGWRMPENTVKVDRTTPWGNPFIVGEHGTRAECVQLYTRLMQGFLCVSLENAHEQERAYKHVLEHSHELRGKNLACWCRLCDKHRDGKPLGVECPDCAPCHAAILLEVANG